MGSLGILGLRGDSSGFPAHWLTRAGFSEAVAAETDVAGRTDTVSPVRASGSPRPAGGSLWSARTRGIILLSLMSGGAETIAAPDTEDWRDNRAVGVSAWERFSFWCLRVVLRAHKAVWGARGLYASCKAFGTLEYLMNYKFLMTIFSHKKGKC